MKKKVLQTKIIIVGDVGVGKSSVAYRYIENQFNEEMDGTLGATYMQKIHTINNDKDKTTKSIKLKIWDTAGQQKYKALAKLYYKDSQAVLFVYDISRKNSISNTKIWADEVCKFTPQNTIFVVVANKIDLIECSSNPDSKITNSNTTDINHFQQGQQFAKSIGAKFFKVSAKTSHGINQLFSTLAELLIEHLQKLSPRSPSSQKLLKINFNKQQANAQKKSCCHQS